MRFHQLFFTALILLEIVTVVGLFVILGSRTIVSPGGVSELLGDTGNSKARRGDLLPPPEILARDIVYNTSFVQSDGQSNDLKGYLAAFPPVLARRILSLSAHGRILDAGAGEAVFAEQLVTLVKDTSPGIRFSDERNELFEKLLIRPLEVRPSVVAVDVEIRRKDIPSYGGRLEILSGRLLEEVPADILGQFNLIIDNNGVFAYASRIDKVLIQYLSLLRLNGSIFIALGEPESGYGTLSRVNTKARGSITMVQWLKSLEGLSVEIAGYKGLRLAAIISRGSGKVVIRPLKLSSLEPRGSDPPIRLYSESGGY